MEALVIPVLALMIYLLAPADTPPPPKPDRITLLPAPDGTVGALLVKPSGGSEQKLETAYASVETDKASTRLTAVDPVGVQARYGTVLASQPPRPISLTVYFKSGSDTPAEDSLAVIDRLQRELRQRPSPEVVLIGHTDRVGKVDDNDRLSLKRAEAMRKALIEVGVAGTAIDVAGRGEREPLIATADEVAEARNRRVEISVR